MTKKDDDENGKKFTKAKQYLAYLLQKHLLLSGDIQDVMFNAVKREEDGGFHFFDATRFETHAVLSRHFIATLNTHKAHYYLERAYVFWSEQFAPAVLALEDEKERTSFVELPKLLAAYLLIAGEYSKVVVCLAHAIRLNEVDSTCRVLILRWLCHLGEWQLAREQLRIEAQLAPICGKHYEAIMDIFANIVALNTMPNKEEVVNRLVSQWIRLDEMGSKTFMQYQCQALLRRALLIASRLPHADIKKIGDPLKNLEMEIGRLTVLVKNRHQAFFNYGEGIEMQKKVVNPDEFLKLCSQISEHFEATLLQCYELAETGVLRECEGIVMNLWRQSLRLGSLSRTLVSVNLLMMVVLMSSYMRQRRDSLRRVYTALLNVSNCNNSSRTLTERSPHPRCAKEPSLASMMLNAFCYGGESGDGGSSEKEDEEDELESHSDNCSCVVCAICAHNPPLQFDVSFASFIFNSFSSRSFQSMAIKFRTLKSQFTDVHSCLCSAIGVANVEVESCYPLSTRDLFVTAAVRWLRKNGAEEKPEIRDKVIRESLKICELEPCHHRWQWLTIRQTRRQSAVVIDHISHLPWMLLPSASSDRIPLSSLAQEFNALSLQTPRKAQSQKTPQSGQTKCTHKTAIANDDEAANKTKSCHRQLLQSANEDFEQFSHLFYREWRHAICSNLAYANLSDTWMSAYFFSEATCFATRQLARAVDEEGESFRYENLEQFKAAVQALPADITVVQMFLDASRILWLIRLHCERAPMIVPLTTIPPEDDLLRRMEVLLQENDISGKMGATCKDAKKFWALRRRLDKSMEVIIRDAESGWMREFACLLLPCSRLTEYGSLAALEMVKCGISKNSANVLVEMCSILSVHQWRRLAERFAILDGVRRVSSSLNTLCRLRNACIDNIPKGEPLIDDSTINYTLLAVSPELASFPFEMAPVLTNFQHVCRIISLYFFQRVFMRSKKIPKPADGRNSFYLLDPGGDLAETQNRLAELLRTIECWKGLIGESPDPKQLKASLENSDFFFYMGHGSGGRYFGKATIRKTDCRAVSVLMGCSSARTTHEGEGLDGRNAIYDYSVARCPCVVGCLWMVTDGEIDRFFVAMITYCFSEEIVEAHAKRNKNGGSYRLLIDALAYARTACKLRYMTGAAVVSYGLPIMSANSHFLKTNTSRKAIN